MCSLIYLDFPYEGSILICDLRQHGQSRPSTFYMLPKQGIMLVALPHTYV